MARWPFGRRREPAGSPSALPVGPASASASSVGSGSAAGPASGPVRTRPAWLRLPPLRTATSPAAPVTMDLSGAVGALDVVGVDQRSPAPLPPGPAGRVSGLVRPVAVAPDPIDWNPAEPGELERPASGPPAS